MLHQAKRVAGLSELADEYEVLPRFIPQLNAFSDWQTGRPHGALVPELFKDASLTILRNVIAGLCIKTKALYGVPPVILASEGLPYC